MSPDDDDLESKRLGCGSWWRLYACVCLCLLAFATVFHDERSSKYLLLHMEMFAFTLHRTGEDVCKKWPVGESLCVMHSCTVVPRPRVGYSSVAPLKIAP